MKKDNLFINKEQPTSTYMYLTEIARLLDGEMSLACDDLKLASGARRILACLEKQDGVSQLDLVRATHLRAATISLIAQKMELDGLITRHTDEIDQRRTRVHVTEKGRKLYESVEAASKAIENKAMDGFSEQEKRAFHSMLVRIYANMDMDLEG